MFDLEKKIRRWDLFDDNYFKKLIEKEFLNDLKNVNELRMLHPEEMNDAQKFLLDTYKGKYKPNKGCPSAMYDKAPKALQEEYDLIHNKICEVIYKY